MMPLVSSPAVLHKRLFLNDAERSFQLWVPLVGHLQRTVMEGEYLPLGPLLPMFESDFLQVTNQGEAVFLHNKENPVTMGVASSIPGLLLPDVILLARPVGNKRQKQLELTRLLPTHLAGLFVHNVASWRLKLRLASGRSFYLQLDADWREGCFLFNRWRYLVYLLQGPVPAWAPQAYRAQHPTLLSPARKLKAKTQKISRAGSTTLKAKEMVTRAVGDSLSFMTQLEPPVYKEEKKPGHRRSKMGIPGNQVEEEGQSNVTIWTLFSIISSTLNQPKASKASAPISSTSGPSRMEPCMVPCQTSSSWMGSRQPFKKIFHSSDSSSTYLYLSSQPRMRYSTTWASVHQHRCAWFKSPSILSKALAWIPSLSHVWAQPQPQPQPQDLQHEVPRKTTSSDKFLRKVLSKLNLKSKKAAELPHVQFSQQEETSLLAKKQFHPKSTPHLNEATRMSHLSTKASLYPPLKDSPDHFIKALEPPPSPKTPMPSPKVPEPSHSPKVPEPSHSPKVPQPFHSPKVPQPSPSLKAPQPYPSPKAPEPSVSTKATPKESTKASPQNSKKSAFYLSTKASSKHSKNSTFHPFTKASHDHFTKDLKAHPIKASADQAIKASADQVVKTSGRSSSDQSLASTAVLLSLYTPDSTIHSKKASSDPSTKASSKHSKKSSFHPTPKASPDQLTKDSKAYPIKASADQAVKVSDRSLSDQSLVSTAVSLALYTPDSTSHSKEAPSYPSTKASFKHSKKSVFYLFTKASSKYSKKSVFYLFTKASSKYSKKSVFYLFTKASSKHSKKSSFHPTPKASPDQLTKDSKTHPIKASADQAVKASADQAIKASADQAVKASAGQAVKVSDRSLSDQSLVSTVVSLSLYTPDSTSHSKEASSYPSTKASSKHSKKSSFHPTPKASPDQLTKDSKAHPIKASADQAVKALADQAVKASADQAIKASGRSSSDQSLASTAVSLSLYTPDSTSHSKEASSYPSTKASSKHSKKSSFHPTPKASPDQLTKDSKTHPIKASADQAVKASADQAVKASADQAVKASADQAVKVSDRSLSDQSLVSTVVSLSLYTPDSTSHSKEASSYPSTKTLSGQSKKTSKSPSNKSSPRAVS